MFFLGLVFSPHIYIKKQRGSNRYLQLQSISLIAEKYILAVCNLGDPLQGSGTEGEESRATDPTASEKFLLRKGLQKWKTKADHPFLGHTFPTPSPLPF